MKKILAIILALATALACCGCSGSDAQQTAAPGEMGEMRGGNRANAGFPGEMGGMGNMGAAGAQSEIPAGGHAVIGTVQDIVGNEATLLVSSRVEAGEEAASGGGDRTWGASRGERPGGMGDGSRPERPEGTDGGSLPEPPDGMTPPDGSFGAPPSDGGEATADAAADGSAAADTAETDGAVQPSDGEPDADAAGGEETLVCLLPVGMHIGQGDFSSVSAGDTLRIVYNASGVIVAVDTL